MQPSRADERRVRAVPVREVGAVAGGAVWPRAVRVGMRETGSGR
jgi:hypothetical protein